MPTYNWRCGVCGRGAEHFLSIGEYVRNPPAFVCCGEVMGRCITVDSAPALANALASERHYDGLQAPDGSDISSRSKHRAYMKANGLTTVDDYTKTWAKDAQQRADRMAGNDPGRAQDVANAMRRHGG